MLHTEEIMDKKLNKNKRLLSVAPMMDWTDKSVFMRVFSLLSVISP
jgi:tRNA-dihydrouridine synthase